MSASVKLIETVGGKYGYHEKWGEVNRYDVSDTPTWRFWLAYAVQVVVTGAIEWGPYKTRWNAKNEHSGRTKVSLTVTEFFDDTNACEKRGARAQALLRMKEIMLLLNASGFLVEKPKFWGRRYANPQDEMSNPLIRRRVEIIADPPPARFRKRIEEKVFLETIMPEK